MFSPSLFVTATPAAEQPATLGSVKLDPGDGTPMDLTVHRLKGEGGEPPRVGLEAYGRMREIVAELATGYRLDPPTLPRKILNAVRQFLRKFGFKTRWTDRDIERILARVIGENTTILTTLDPALGAVEADPGQLEQVLMNPRHPYTKLLRESIPEADPKRRWVGEIRLSDTEQDEYLSQGCRFAGRCPLVMDLCRSTPPPDYGVEDVLV